ncbi:hypothetical protein, partial [Parachitinimonas caeni]
PSAVGSIDSGVSYRYDLAGRRQGSSFANAKGTVTESYDYSEDDQLIGIVSNGVNQVRALDLQGRVVSQYQTRISDQPGSAPMEGQVQNRYDRYGRLSWQKLGELETEYEY